jgi:hypothetical protein
MASVDARQIRKKQGQEPHAFKNRKHGPPKTLLVAEACATRHPKHSQALRLCHPPRLLAGYKWVAVVRVFQTTEARAVSYLGKALAKRDLLMCIPPFASSGPWYLIKPSFLNLFIKKLTCARVAPIIVARVSCDIPANRCRLR